VTEAPAVAAAGLVLAWCLPLVAALALALAVKGWREIIIRLSPWAAIPALLCVLWLPPQAAVEFSWLLLGTHLGLDHAGRVFLGFTALLWGVSAAYARGYLAGDARRVSFFASYLAAMAGNLGLAVAQDMASFLAFFALMSFSAYPLVVHERHIEARRAGRIYLTLVVMGEVLLFTGLLLVFQSGRSMILSPSLASTAGPLALGLLAGGFGIKAGALFLHVWLPLAHPVAPTPASAVLSGAMIKAGLLGWMRFLPFAEADSASWGALFVAAGVAAAFYGAFVGLLQGNPKTVLAYSSVSQMGLMTVALGAGLLAPAALPLAQTAVLLYATHHALVKGALFLGVGAVPACSGVFARRAALAGVWLPALSLAGLPLTSGAVAKTALKQAAVALPSPWSAGLGLALPLAAVGTTLLMAKFLYLVARMPVSPPAKDRQDIVAPWALLVGCVALGIWAWPLAGPAVADALTPGKLWLSLWPALAGALLAGAAIPFKLGERWPEHWRVPPGDVLVPVEAFASWLRGIWRPVAARVASTTARVSSGQPADRVSRLAARTLLAEVQLRRWANAGLLFLALLTALFLAAGG
jgi:formate hydrogenlyase subunit 3/multisubunit Na+/H+ antiporter MnhD subunit